MENIIEFASRLEATGSKTWTFVCVCKKCATKTKMIRIQVSLLPAVAQKLGYGMDMTTAEFKRMNHLMVQANG